eukprot:8710220-Pyramimonas_sp.AAC.1
MLRGTIASAQHGVRATRARRFSRSRRRYRKRRRNAMQQGRHSARNAPWGGETRCCEQTTKQQI